MLTKKQEYTQLSLHDVMHAGGDTLQAILGRAANISTGDVMQTSKNLSPSCDIGDGYHSCLPITAVYSQEREG